MGSGTAILNSGPISPTRSHLDSPATEYKGLKYTAEDFSKMTRSEAEYRRQLMAMSKEEVSAVKI